jgi:hypothetical protein
MEVNSMLLLGPVYRGLPRDSSLSLPPSTAPATLPRRESTDAGTWAATVPLCTPNIQRLSLSSLAASFWSNSRLSCPSICCRNSISAAFRGIMLLARVSASVSLGMSVALIDTVLPRCLSSSNAGFSAVAFSKILTTAWNKETEGNKVKVWRADLLNFHFSRYFSPSPPHPPGLLCFSYVIAPHTNIHHTKYIVHTYVYAHIHTPISTTTTTRTTPDICTRVHTCKFGGSSAGHFQLREKNIKLSI